MTAADTHPLTLDGRVNELPEAGDYIEGRR